ncbi:outer membrane protein [Bradyrhizobium septentrionale]|uniref:Outer membrane beta-barrel protein n=1 Tax=Bradyrhizobium septentrionale TaxID=1404411 RepID=A0A973W7N8_9BRAD|nr:outer membrane beta-barrel protein [Bradyrhizobium septentrionale]UGY17500.1 outer membrane beta-barrel protein [Bradyrhizobium septentrionale]UGY26240.1 outer membrane beta-barrel protein [Bradyrhizobium septentrionale]
MRRFLLAAMMMGAVTAAHAADLPDFPALRGGFSDAPSAPVNWRGFYIGGQGGYGSSDENFSGTNANMLAALLDHNVIQQMDVSNWNLGLGKASQRSAAYGAFAGYNWQYDDVVVGIDASYMHGKFGGSSTASKELVSGTALTDTLFHDVRVDSSAAIQINDMATIRGRAGYAWGCFLPYIFGGVAFGNADISRSVTVHDAVSTTISGPFTPLATLNANDVQHNHLIYGYTGGLGFDVNITGGLFMRAEWEYVRFTSTVDTTINTVRAGLGYKF